MAFPQDVPGDGTLLIEIEERTMADPIDISSNVANVLLTETTGNIQASNQRQRDSAGNANAVLQFAAARNFDELGTLESRANSGVIATPIASPTKTS